METLLIGLVIIGLLATLAALATGVGSMVHGGHFDKAHSHHLMFARVGAQVLTLLLILLAVMILM